MIIMIISYSRLCQWKTSAVPTLFWLGFIWRRRTLKKRRSMHTNAVNTARYVYIIKCTCMFSWWISSNDTTSTVFPKCKCLLILILFHQSRESGKSLLRQIASARASVEPPRDCSFSQELSLGHLLTDPAQALMSPVDQVSPMNLNFNTP